jgi:hypothetical protein
MSALELLVGQVDAQLLEPDDLKACQQLGKNATAIKACQQLGKHVSS